MLRLRLIYLPLVSPSSPDNDPLLDRDRDGERETKRPPFVDSVRERDRRRRRSGELSREEGGVREGVREETRRLLAPGSEELERASSWASSFWNVGEIAR
jgi:hypothetical protein